jgi:hypothetical protein
MKYVFKSKNMSPKLEVNIGNLAILLYSCESWTLTAKIETSLNSFELPDLDEGNAQGRKSEMKTSIRIRVARTIGQTKTT